jgi:hypothetical protein
MTASPGTCNLQFTMSRIYNAGIPEFLIVNSEL